MRPRGAARARGAAGADRRLIPAGAPSCAIRLDGRFELVRARSVPGPEPALPAAGRGRRRPARLRARRTSPGRCSASASPPGSRGSRSPATTCTSSATTAAAAATCSTRALAAGLRLRIDPSDDLHVELPPAVELADPDLAAATHAAIASVEGG